jgi:hypothetical protein
MERPEFKIGELNHNCTNYKPQSAFQLHGKDLECPQIFLFLVFYMLYIL